MAAKKKTNRQAVKAAKQSREFSVQMEPPEPGEVPLEKALAIFGKLKPKENDDLYEALEQAGAKGWDFDTLARTLATAGRFDELEQLARTALTQGYRGEPESFLAWAHFARGRDAEGEREMARSLLLGGRSLVFYMPVARFLSIGDTESAVIAYHGPTAGKHEQVCFGFRKAFPKAPPGKPPPNVLERYAALYAKLVKPRWDVASFDIDMLENLIDVFDRRFEHAKPLAPLVKELQAELRRRPPRDD